MIGVKLQTMNDTFILTKQISKSNYFSEEDFVQRIADIVNDNFENYHFQHFGYKDIFIKSELTEIILFDIENFWQEKIELNFDFADFQEPDSLIEMILSSIEIVKKNPKYNNENIVIKLHTYLIT
jgi:hypothetical protein